jgi:hypothetical protein
MKTRLKKPFLIREKPNPDRDKKLRTSGNEPEVFYLVLTVLSSKLNAKSMGMSIHYSGCIREKEMLDPLIEEVADICSASAGELNK